MEEKAARRYVPALRFDGLTRFYDLVIRFTMPEKKFRQALINQADLDFNPHFKVLDFGCGTAALAIGIKKAYGRIRIFGVDVDPGILALAHRKVQRSQLEIHLTTYDGSQLPYGEVVFDRVLSSLVFHHLTSYQKGVALEEIYRVLKPGGELHLADWGKASTPLMRGAFYLIQLLDGFQNTRDNVLGRLPAYLENAGFCEVKETRSFSTLFGTLSLYQARKI